MSWVTAAPAIPRLVLETRVVGVPTDSFTGQPPATAINYELLIVRLIAGQTVRQPTGFTPFVTGRGFVTFPTLEESPATTGQRFAILVDSDEVRPLYPDPAQPGFEFTFPGAGGLRLVPITLHPGPPYLFPRYLSVVRGLVLIGGAPAAGVVLSSGGDVAMSDAAGRFSLGVRAFTDGLPLTVQADDRLGHTGAFSQVVPDIFQHNINIHIA